MSHMSTDSVRKRRDAFTVVFAIVVSLLLAGGMGSFAWMWQRLDSYSQNQKALAAQVEALGGTPIVAPPEASKSGLSSDQVRAIVVAEVSKQKASLTQAEINQIARVAAGMIPRPKDGASPTSTQIHAVVVAAVAAYCTGDKCVGKPGSVGTPGKDGKPGVDGAPGKDAPKVTDEELLKAAQQALASYCAQDSQPCKGADGKQGDPGRGIANVKCQDNGTWLFTYTDGSTDSVDGPCRVVVDPPSLAAR